jgi:hypothetical protein
MQTLVFVIIAGLAGLGVFAFLAKKYGSECMP